MLELFKLKRGTVGAWVLLAAGVIGTVLDPDGPVGITLFGVAAVAALYLVARPFRKAVRRFAAAPSRTPAPRRTVARVVRGRRVTMIVAAMGALFTVWLTVDMARPFVYACWWTFCLLGAWLIAVTALTARRSLQGTK
jgi:hypothetical protein